MRVGVLGRLRLDRGLAHEAGERDGDGALHLVRVRVKVRGRVRGRGRGRTAEMVRCTCSEGVPRVSSSLCTTCTIFGSSGAMCLARAPM